MKEAGLGALPPVVKATVDSRFIQASLDELRSNRDKIIKATAACNERRSELRAEMQKRLANIEKQLRCGRSLPVFPACSFVDRSTTPLRALVGIAREPRRRDRGMAGHGGRQQQLPGTTTGLLAPQREACRRVPHPASPISLRCRKVHKEHSPEVLEKRHLASQARLEARRPWLERQEELERRKGEMQLDFEQSIEKERQARARGAGSGVDCRRLLLIPLPARCCFQPKKGSTLSLLPESMSAFLPPPGARLQAKRMLLCAEIVQAMEANGTTISSSSAAGPAAAAAPTTAPPPPAQLARGRSAAAEEQHATEQSADGAAADAAAGRHLRNNEQQLLLHGSGASDGGDDEAFAGLLITTPAGAADDDLMDCTVLCTAN